MSAVSRFRSHGLATAAVLLLLLSSNTRAQDSSRTFLEEFRPGARAIGLGGSLVVQARDASAIFWNPALLPGLLDRQVLISVNEPFSFDYVGFTQFIPLYGTIGVAWARDVSENQVVDRGTLAWGRRFSRVLAFGVNLNLQKHGTAWFADSGVGVLLGNPKLGSLGHPWRDTPREGLWQRLNLGFAVRNLPVGDRLFHTAGELGVSYAVRQLGVVLNSGYTMRKGTNTPHLGFGLELNRNLMVLAGLESFNVDKLGLGMGYSHDNFQFNLTYSTQTDALLLSLTSRISPPPPTLAEPYYEKAAAAFEAKDYAAAVREYRKFLAFDLKSPRADTAARRVRVLERKLAHDRMLVDSLFSVSARLLAKGESKYLYAAVILTKILELDPDNLKARSKMAQVKPYIDEFVKKSIVSGILAFDRKNYFQAQKAFKRALIFEPENAVALNYNAQIDKVLRDLAEQYFYRGVGYYTQKDYAQAREELLRAIEYNPDHKEASSYLTRTMAQLAENEKRVTALIKEGQRLEKQRRFVEASKKYLEVLKLDPENEFVRGRLEVLRSEIVRFVNDKYQLGLRYMRAQEYAKADEAFTEVLSLDPKHRGARINRTRMRQERRQRANNYLAQAEEALRNEDWSQALSLYAKVLAMEPRNAQAMEGRQEAEKRLQIDDLLQQARQAGNNQQYTQAINIYNRILNIDADYQMAKVEREAIQSKVDQLVEKYFNEAMTFYALDQYEEAVRALDKALQLDPAHKGSLEYRRRAQERLQALRKLRTTK